MLFALKITSYACICFNLCKNWEATRREEKGKRFTLLVRFQLM